VENAAIFVVGGPCSGKDKIIKTLKEHLKIDELDIQTVGKVDHIPRQIIVNGSADRLDEITRTNDLLKHNGYKTSLIFVDVDNEISRLRNEARKLRGQRMLKESVRFAKYETAKNNKQTLEKLFGEQMTAVDNSKNDKPSKREWGTKSLTKNYTAKTPGQSKRGLEDFDMNPWESKEGGGYGLTTGLAGPPGPGGLAEVRLSVRLWAENPKTIERFAKKYGDLAEKKLMEAAAALTIADKARNLGPKPFGKIRESFDKGLLDSPIFGRKEDDLGEDGPIKRKRFAKKRKQINILPPQPKG
jgi:sulfur carrier protein ThiS